MKVSQHSSQKGFTLIELLVVIGIVAILSVVLVLTLNPAQLLRQARDSTRISDFATLKAALTLYLADVASPSLGTDGTCYAYASSTVTSSGCGGRYVQNLTTSTASTSRAVTGGGWIPVNFGAISSGAPISIEPVDPINNATNWDGYAASSTTQTFKLTAEMESTRYSSGGGSGDVESTDGGTSSTLYEIGTAPGLVL